MRARRDVFQALADPNRRQIIQLLSKGSVNLSVLAQQFSSTRQAIALHVKILEQCGLVQVKQYGREKICEAKLERLNEVYEWVKQYKSVWTKRKQSSSGS